MAGPQLIIKQQKSASWYLGWGAAFAILLAGSYLLGRYHAGENERELTIQVAYLQAELDKYQQAYQKANQELVMKEQSAKVDDLSSQQLIETVKDLQTREQELQAELKFYRNIMAPELEKQGLTIAEFDVTQTSPESNPKFRLVLTQVGKQDQYIKGVVEMKLHGKLGGEEKVYPFRELGTFQSKDFKFQFRYFQNIEGELSLPEGFTAEFVTVQARTQGLKKNQSTQVQVDWTI